MYAKKNEKKIVNAPIPTFIIAKTFLFRISITAVNAIKSIYTVNKHKTIIEPIDVISI